MSTFNSVNVKKKTQRIYMCCVSMSGAPATWVSCVSVWPAFASLVLKTRHTLWDGNNAKYFQAYKLIRLRDFFFRLLVSQKTKRYLWWLLNKNLFYPIKVLAGAAGFPLPKIVHVISDEHLAAHLTFRGKIRFDDSAATKVLLERGAAPACEQSFTVLSAQVHKAGWFIGMKVFGGDSWDNGYEGVNEVTSCSRVTAECA